jgi:hypothetical protein
MNAETSEAYEEKLREVRAVIERTRRLMASEREETQLKAIDLFLKLSELEIAFIHAIDEASGSRSDNPLVRRLRLAT